MDIVRALEEGRPDEAQQTMDDHLAYVLQYSIDITGGTTA